MSLSKQFLRFAAVGATGTATQYALLWLGVEFVHIGPVIASTIGYAGGSIVNYLLNYRFTFASGKSHLEAAPKYYAVIGVGLLINTALMGWLTGSLGWYYWPAQLLTTALGLCWNFAGSRWWAFTGPTARGPGAR